VQHCWHCNSTAHLSFQCVVRPKEGATDVTQSVPYNAGTNRAVVQGASSQQPGRASHGAVVYSVGTDTGFKVIDGGGEATGAVHAHCTKLCTSVNVVNRNSSHAEIPITGTENNEAKLKLAQLHYLSVNIRGSKHC
jgi:hypothetical protein